MLLRSLLFIPATSAQSRLERLAEDRATLPLPDAIIVDLEDSVPEAAKALARAALAAALHTAQGLTGWGTEVYVRVNGVRTPYCVDDLEALAPWVGRGVGVMISKCVGAEDVAGVMERLEMVSGAAVIPLIETLRACAIARPRWRLVPRSACGTWLWGW
ncbi:MAG: hypothetical protein IPF55_19310 [Rhodoferax sp.]|nr:hypothetical protein [Rhodoferax sp.]